MKSKDMVAGEQESVALADVSATSGIRRDEFVYALGTIEPRFPSLAVEKEFAQAVRLTQLGKDAGATGPQLLRAVLSNPLNRYLARELCYVLTIQGLETYLLLMRDVTDIDLLVNALSPDPSPEDANVVVGTRGAIAAPELCNGLMVPVVAVDQIWTFKHSELIESIHRPASIPEKDDDQFRVVARELFYRVLQIADNIGATDGHRALNFVILRYDRIYAVAAEQQAKNATLTSVDVRLSALSGARRVLDIIFSFTDLVTDVVQKFRVAVDATEKYPFLVTKLTPYFDH